MIKINTILNNKAWYRYIKNPNSFIERKIKNINKKLKRFKKNEIFLTILLSSDNEIRKLNKKFRKKLFDRCLSFPFYKKVNLKKN